MDIILTICAVISTFCLILITVDIERMLSDISKQLYSIDVYTKGNNAVLQELRDIEKYGLYGKADNKQK